MRSKRLKRNAADSCLVNSDDPIEPSIDDQPSVTSNDTVRCVPSPTTASSRKRVNKNCRNQPSTTEKDQSLQVPGVVGSSNESKSIHSQGETPKKPNKRLLRFRNTPNCHTTAKANVKSSSHLSSDDSTAASPASDQITKANDPKAIPHVNSHSSSSSENKSNITYSRSNKTTNSTSKANVINATLPLSTGKPQITYPSMLKSNLTLTSVPRKTYGISAKFIVDLPELSDCTGDPSDAKQDIISLLPDRICLLHADLPLKYLAQSEASGSKVPYAYRQILSPDTATHSCLLCPNKSNLSLSELKSHYSSVHELHCEVKSVKFPDDVIYACLPKETFDCKDDENIVLNCSCQYCDNTNLETLKSMVDHYAVKHNNRVSFVEQESVLNMHKFFYCFLCNDVEFNSFKPLNEHMKRVHKMQTYPCRECNFFTREEVRLKSHFKAKHMLNSANQQAMQCLECSFCNGLLMGKERMNRHIQSTHCIETFPGEFSCLSCHQIAGTCDTIISHMSQCPSLQRTQSPNKPPLPTRDSNVSMATDCASIAPENEINSTEIASSAVQVPASDASKSQSEDISKLLPESNQPEGPETDCFICRKPFDSMRLYRLHMSHVHTKWIKRKSELEHVQLLVSHLPTNDEITAAGVTAANGFYCHFCETVISVYSLFYLHMSNLHKMRKVYQCKISSCHDIFYSAHDLRQHSESTLHPQRSVIEDTLGAICCHFCDEYFKDRKEFELHHLTEQHNIRVPACKSLTSGRQEARNHKCKTCHTWFGLTDSFVFHMENETHKHPCPYCGIDFALPSSRRTHIQSHHTDKSDVCEICSLKQGSKERLFPHLVTHGVMFECNTCIKVFYQKEQLNCHLETHAPLVSCHWPGCERNIASSSLSLHIKQHRVQANSKCKTCGKVFSSPYLLESHHEVHLRAEEKAMQIMQVSKLNSEPAKNGSHSRNKVHSCRLCGVTAASQTELSQHKCKSKRTTPNNSHLSTQPAAKSTSISTNCPTLGAPQASPQSIDISLMDTYLIQNPDGTIVELRVPAGMDLNEAINSLTVANDSNASQVFPAVDTRTSVELDDEKSGDRFGPLNGDRLALPNTVDAVNTHIRAPCEQLIYITSEDLGANPSTNTQEIVTFHPLNSGTINLLSVAPTTSIASSGSDCF